MWNLPMPRRNIKIQKNAIISKNTYDLDCGHLALQGSLWVADVSSYD